MELLLTRISQSIAEDDWIKAGEMFELGQKNARQLALLLGLSPQTFARQMERRGYRRCARINEVISEGNAYYSQRAKLRSERQTANSALALRRVLASRAVLDVMIQALMDAERSGDVALASPIVDAAAVALGYQIEKR